MMARNPDGQTGLSEALLCEVVGCSPQLRRTWIKRGLLASTRGPLGELDALELATLSRLQEALGPRDCGLVWSSVRQLLRDELVRGRWDLVVDLQYKTASVARDDEAVAKSVRHGRSVRVLPLGDELAPLVDAVGRLLRDAVPEPAYVKRSRGGGDASRRNAE